MIPGLFGKMQFPPAFLHFSWIAVFDLTVCSSPPPTLSEPPLNDAAIRTVLILRVWLRIGSVKLQEQRHVFGWTHTRGNKFWTMWDAIKHWLIQMYITLLFFCVLAQLKNTNPENYR